MSERNAYTVIVLHPEREVEFRMSNTGGNFFRHPEYESTVNVVAYTASAAAAHAEADLKYGNEKVTRVDLVVSNVQIAGEQETDRE